jgi:hypothetical protein
VVVDTGVVVLGAVVGVVVLGAAVDVTVVDAGVVVLSSTMMTIGTPERPPG